MADWDDGYVTDIAYTSGYHRETSPVWIATAATLRGFGSPDLTGSFRFADLGCGNGVTALVVAATTPHAEVWGFDFNPAHIEAARSVARRAGLTNIHFEELSFDDLASLPRDALPPFDYIAAHGVLSWVSLENRRRMFDAIGQRLAPGGICYISYNVATGWAGMPPIRTLMRLLAEASPERSDLAATSVFETLEKMRQAGAAMFKTHPALEPWLTMFGQQDRRYVAHELLNRDWHPVMFRAVASSMAAIKCGYIGSATLQENITSHVVPAGLHEMLNQTADAIPRETLRDIACCATFRRDLFQRGTRPLNPAEFNRRTDAIGLTRTFQPMPETMVLDTPVGRFTANKLLYDGLLEALDTGPMTIGQLRQRPLFSGLSAATAREAATLLLHAGLAAPMAQEQPSTEAAAAVSRLNSVHAALIDDGDDRPFLAYAALGAAWPAEIPDILAVDALRECDTLEVLGVAAAVTQRLNRTGRQLHQDGQPITDPNAVSETVVRMIQGMVRDRLPAMRRLGALPDTSARAS